jgi:hypothetical protein
MPAPKREMVTTEKQLWGLPDGSVVYNEADGSVGVVRTRKDSYTGEPDGRMVHWTPHYSTDEMELVQLPLVLLLRGTEPVHPRYLSYRPGDLMRVLWEDLREEM